jgi:hypothetical protein
VLFVLGAGRASACFHSPFDLRVVIGADAVVVGRAVGFDVEDDGRRYIIINVERALFGRTPKITGANWATYVDRMPDSFKNTRIVAALKRSNNDFYVIGNPCKGSFISTTESTKGKAMVEIFSGEGDPRIKAETLAKALLMDGSGRF